MRPQIVDQGLDSLAANIMSLWPARLILWTFAAAFVCLNRSLPAGLALGAGAIVVEIWTWLAARPYRAGKEGSPARRWFTLGAMTAVIVVATAIVALFWGAGSEALRVVAVAITFTLLLHVQLFLARSTAVLFIGSVIPTATLIVLVIFSGNYHGMSLVTAAVVPIAAFTYVICGGIIGKRNAESLEAARTEAIVANQSKTAFLAMMSHELRTPMNGVLGMAHALKLTPLNRQQAEQVDVLLQSGEGLMTVLSDILDVSKNEAGRLEFEAIAVDIPGLCSLTCNLWADAASAKNVDLSFDVDPATPRWLLGDPTRLRQIITNLVSNALKFTEHGSVKLSVRPLPGAPEGYARIQLSVSDTGIGLSETQQARLFQPFTQAAVSTTREYGGTGLGLNICKRLAVMMDGDVTVESSLGEGSTFHLTLTLPLASEPLAAEDQADGQSIIAGLRILVVEDNAVNRMVASTILGAVGVEIETANDGVEALEALQACQFDLVLMDIHMPRMGGAEALVQIRGGHAGSPDIPVIALTADAMNDQQQRLLALGFDAVQVKPIQPSHLIAAIAAVGHRRVLSAQTS